MSKAITFSRLFPKGHPNAGLHTFFVEQILNSLNVSINDVVDQAKPLINDFAMLEGSKKHHTIRAGNRWKVGDKFSPRVWGTDINPKSGKSGPYQSKQITFAPDIEIKKVWNFESKRDGTFWLNSKQVDVTSCDIPKNDGLSIEDFLSWFPEKDGKFQIICWNENIEYSTLPSPLTTSPFPA